MLMRLIFLVLAWSTVLAAARPAPAAPADPVQLTIQDGRVTLVATNASIRQILADWARIGRTRIVNGERVPGGLVTLQLTNVPEEEALDLLLRSAAGYIAAPRAAGSLSDGSRFDRILILPTSAVAPASAVRAAAPAPAFPAPQPATAPRPVFVPPGAQPVIGPDGKPVPDDQDDDAPGAPRPPPYVPLPPGFDGASPQQPRPVAPAAPGVTPGMPGPTPATPAGVPVPGMVVPAPAQPGVPREAPPPGPRQR